MKRKVVPTIFLLLAASVANAVAAPSTFFNTFVKRAPGPGKITSAFIQQEGSFKLVPPGKLPHTKDGDKRLIHAKLGGFSHPAPPSNTSDKPPEPLTPAEMEKLRNIVLNLESGGKNKSHNGKTITSSKGAKYAMQVMPRTARNPGFDIKPAKSNTAKEYNRVGRELLVAMSKTYQDPAKVLAAYNAGITRLGSALEQVEQDGRAGKTWLDLMPKETRQYVEKGMRKFGGIPRAQQVLTNITFVSDKQLAPPPKAPGKETRKIKANPFSVPEWAHQPEPPPPKDPVVPAPAIEFRVRVGYTNPDNKAAFDGQVELFLFEEDNPKDGVVFIKDGKTIVSIVPSEKGKDRYTIQMTDKDTPLGLAFECSYDGEFPVRLKNCSGPILESPEKAGEIHAGLVEFGRVADLCAKAAINDTNRQGRPVKETGAAAPYFAPLKQTIGKMLGGRSLPALFTTGLTAFEGGQHSFQRPGEQHPVVQRNLQR